VSRRSSLHEWSVSPHVRTHLTPDWKRVRLIIFIITTVIIIRMLEEASQLPRIGPASCLRPKGMLVLVIGRQWREMLHDRHCWIGQDLGKRGGHVSHVLLLGQLCSVLRQQTGVLPPALWMHKNTSDVP
jgi:hypothetical protein